jgi:hypothetical protein
MLTMGSARACAAAQQMNSRGQNITDVLQNQADSDCGCSHGGLQEQ